MGTNRIRIFHTLSGLKVGGIVSLLLHNLEYMDRDHFENIICCLGNNVQLEERFVGAGYSPIILGHRSGDSLLRLVGRAVRAIRQLRADVVHTNMAFDSRIGAVAGRIAAVPVVATLHNDNPKTLRHLDGVLDRWVVQPSVSRFIAVSQLTRDVHLERRKLPRERVEVIYSGIPTARYARASPSHELRELRAGLPVGDAYPLLLNVGRLYKQKGQKYLIPMMDELLSRWPRAQLLIVGGGDEEAELRRLVKEQALGDSIHLLGIRTDVKQLLEIADVFVFPSLWESFGLAALEAMASGVPVVASRIGGIPEIIQDGVDGVLVPPHDPAAMALAVDKLASSTELATRIGEAAMLTAQSRFDSSKSVRGVEAIYRAVASFSRAH